MGQRQWEGEQNDGDVIMEEEYYKQEEELDYEDDVPTEEWEQVANINESKVKWPAVWGQWSPTHSTEWW